MSSPGTIQDAIDAALPGDDIDGILHEIVAGNDGVADQVLVREVLASSYDRFRDFEAMGMRPG